VVGGAVREWWILAVRLHLDADIGWFFSVASSGFSSVIEHSGAKCWDHLAKGYSIPNMGKMRRWVNAR
jgi:hypothetical protein